MTRRRGDCLACDTTTSLRGRGLCDKCYFRLYQAGVIDLLYPIRQPPSPAAVMAELVSTRGDRAATAKNLGISRSAVTAVMKNPTRPAVAEPRREPWEPWHADAECAGADPELFFNDASRAWPLGRVAAAMSYCDPCPVKAECLADALVHDDVYAIRGGLLPDQRAQLKRGTA